MPATRIQPLTPPARPRAEEFAWRGISGVWQPLDGSFFEAGVSIEWHDFRAHEDLDWARSFHPHALEICLNFSGVGYLADAVGELRLDAGQFAVYTTNPGRPRARRTGGSWHRFLTLEMGRDFLREHFTAARDRLKPAVARFMDGADGSGDWLEIAPLPSSLLAARAELLSPPVPTAARPIWYRAQAFSILAQTLFAADAPEELFCARQQRLNRERIERACHLLERDVENPPSLDLLAREIGCSPSHLSRIFAEHIGMSIPRYLRTVRIQRAAELLQSGRANVTEAAINVGYSSLSAFNKAFVEQMGCCPGLYPQAPISGRSPESRSGPRRSA